MLRDQHERCQRSVRRVELLLGLLTEEDERAGRGPVAGRLRPVWSFAFSLGWAARGRGIPGTHVPSALLQPLSYKSPRCASTTS